jgi:hypothetical protein
MVDQVSRRSLLGGLLGLVAAPAVIRLPGLLMPIKPLVDPRELFLTEFQREVLLSYWEARQWAVGRAIEHLLVTGNAALHVDPHGIVRHVPLEQLHHV